MTVLGYVLDAFIVVCLCCAWYFITESYLPAGLGAAASFMAHDRQFWT